MEQTSIDQRGFILQPTYRIQAGKPVVHLYGRLESGASFLLRDDRERPHFFIPSRLEAEARALGARQLQATTLIALDGEPVCRVEVRVPGDTPEIRDRLTGAGIRCYEADVRFALRYLIDRGIRGSLRVRGLARSQAGLGWVLDRPEVAPARFVPRLSLLSIDIETDPKARRLLSIALSGRGVSEVLLLTPPGWTCPSDAEPFSSERELLAAFCQRVVALDPDILTGWNVIDFDLAVLARMSVEWKVPLVLGRGGGGLRLRPRQGFRASTEATVPGRLVLDGIELVRGAFLRMEEHSLDFVARKVLGRGKSIAGAERAEEILRRFRHDRPAFVEYNRRDAELVLEILARLELVPLAVERSLLTGMPLDRVAASIASFDFLYLGELRKRGVVAPSVDAEAPIEIPTGGGHVLEPLPGLHRHVAVFDFKSLYPSLIRSFEIDPLGFLGERREGAIVAPNGASFRREKGILSGLLDHLFAEREAAKQAGNTVASNAVKILMNSFYGVLGTPACRFYNPAVANAITSFGREILLWTKGRIEALGHVVLYGDTDSLFVRCEGADLAASKRIATELAATLNRDLAAHLAATWGVESRLELQFERLYSWLHLLSVRHGAAGARKRYAGWVEGPDGGQVVFTGLESVRRDATELAKRVQKGLYERLFQGQPVEEYLRGVVADLWSGRLDDQLIYRKALRKPPEDYTATTPPHVAAARKLAKVPRRGLISYRMTLAGPEPEGEHRNPFDYQHYLDKQIRPVAEPVLALLGLEVGRVLGDDRQLGLFG